LRHKYLFYDIFITIVLLEHKSNSHTIRLKCQLNLHILTDIIFSYVKKKTVLVSVYFLLCCGWKSVFTNTWREEIVISASRKYQANRNVN